MPEMKNYDLAQDRDAERRQLLEKVRNAQTAQDMTEAYLEFSAAAEKQVLEEAKRYADLATGQSSDDAILRDRGYQPLTQAEKKYFNDFIKMAKANNVPVDGMVNEQMPETVINRIFEDLTSQHPLLDAVDFQKVNAVTKIFYNKDEIKRAQWGPLTDEFKKQLTSAVGKQELTQFKLSAFVIISKAILDLGPEWLDRYIRIVLSEAFAEGLEYAIVAGTGKDEPIGMLRNLQGPVDPSNGYPEKAAVAFTSLTPDSYVPIIKELIKSPRGGENGRTRSVPVVDLIVNPADNLSIIYPASTLQVATGGYVHNVFPYPTKVYESGYVPQGKAIMGIAKNYFLGMGSGKDGMTLYSDEVRFLEDDRVYATKGYGTGTPKDNNSFVVLDISKLKVTLPKVETVQVTPAGK